MMKIGQMDQERRRFTTFVCLLPILQYYKSPIPGLNLATLIAVVLIPYFILVVQHGVWYRSRKNTVPSLFLMFITINVVVTNSIYEYPLLTNEMLDFFRFAVLVLSILLIGGYYFDLDYALIILKRILIASAIYMIVQLFFYYVLHHPITGNIPALVTNAGYRIARERATGFYMEPAAFAQSAIMFLIFTLFQNRKMLRREIIECAIVVAGILMSGSGQGYLFLAITVFLWYLYNVFCMALTKRKLLIGIGLIILIVIVVYFVMQTSYGQYVLSRVFSEEADSQGLNGFMNGQALRGRTYTNKYFDNLNNSEKWIGVGFGYSEKVVQHYYLNSLYYYLIETGYVSIIAWMLIMLYVFIRGDIRTRMMAIVYMIMFYFTGCGKSMMFCYYFSFLLSTIGTNRRNIERESS